MLKIRATGKMARTYSSYTTGDKLEVHLVDTNLRPTGEKELFHPHDVEIIGYID